MRPAILLLLAILWGWAPLTAGDGEAMGGAPAALACCAPASATPACFTLSEPYRPPPADAAIMVQLRQTLHELGGPFSGSLPGWHPSDPPLPCRWASVECRAGASVTHM